MNRNQFEEKRRLLGHAQPTDEQSLENTETGEIVREGNMLKPESFLEVTRKYLYLSGQ